MAAANKSGQEEKITALYGRLSDDDGVDSESNSIANQYSINVGCDLSILTEKCCTGATGDLLDTVHRALSAVTEENGFLSGKNVVIIQRFIVARDQIFCEKVIPAVQKGDFQVTKVRL